MKERVENSNLMVVISPSICKIHLGYQTTLYGGRKKYDTCTVSEGEHLAQRHLKSKTWGQTQLLYLELHNVQCVFPVSIASVAPHLLKMLRFPHHHPVVGACLSGACHREPIPCSLSSFTFPLFSTEEDPVTLPGLTAVTPTLTALQAS